MKIKARYIEDGDGTENCPECNWSTSRLVKIDEKNEVCPSCFVDWLINNNKTISSDSQIG